MADDAQLDGENIQAPTPSIESLSADVAKLQSNEQANLRVHREVAELRRQVESLTQLVRAMETQMRELIPGWSPPPLVEEPTVTDIISKIRVERNLTLQEIGSHIGLSESQMSRISRGVCEMSTAAQMLLRKLDQQLFP